MVLNHIQSGRFLTEVLDDDNRAAAHLTGLALLVDLAQARPFTQFLVRVYADQGNLMFVAQGSDELLVVGLIERFGQDAEDCLTPKEKDQINYLVCKKFSSFLFQLN